MEAFNFNKINLNDKEALKEITSLNLILYL